MDSIRKKDFDSTAFSFLSRKENLLNLFLGNVNR